ncbi:TIR domain-containing protein [Methylobacterium mesophilicum]
MTIESMISYPSERVIEAHEVVAYLKGLSLNVWFDKESLVAGDDWSREIESALSNSEIVVIITSKETVSKSGVVQRELNRILELLRDRPLGSNYLINLRAEDVALPAEISKFQWIDMFAHDWKAPLLRAVYKKFQQLNRPPTKQVEAAMALLSASTDTQPRSIQEKVGDIEFSSSYFTYSEKNDYWRYINAEIVAAIYRSYYEARGDFIFYGSDRPMGWSLNVEEYYKDDDLLSLKCFWFQDSGGAHPSHGVFTLNFGGTNHGRISLNHVFANSDEVIRHIKRFCELDIKRQQLSIGEDVDIILDDYVSAEDPWDVFQHFSFNDKGITINLSPYSVLPFVYGSHEIFMTWDYFKDKLNDSFAGTQFEKLIKNSL